MNRKIHRRAALKTIFAGVSALMPEAKAAVPETHTFSVFGLLQPEKLILSGLDGSRPRYSSSLGSTTLEAGSAVEIDDRLTPLRVTGPNKEPVRFNLEVPGVIRRDYFGSLEVSSCDGILMPVVRMDREIAVSSIIGAELPVARAPLAALAAQAVVARSFLAGTPAPRHADATFCDTTHCQFLRAPAVPNSPAALATSLTHGLVLAGDDRIFPALYSASCGGATEEGERDGFLYTSSRCEVCRSLNLPRQGHGWGLCQEGAIGLARLGWTWRAILRHYFAGAVTQLL